MKKIILVAAFAMMTVFGAFAQEAKAYCEPAQYMKFGYAGVLGATSNVTGGFDFAVNILELGVRPYDSGRISLGADFQLDVFNAKEDYYFESASHKTAVVPAKGVFDVKRSNFDFLSFAFPLDFTQTIGGKLAITLGASARVNLNADTFTRYKSAAGDYCTFGVEGINTRRFTYDVHVAFTYDDFGVYASYNPLGAFADGYGPKFSFFTVGAIIRMDNLDER